jgi:uncharacterized protein YbbC (DUF1343 family)
MVGICAADDGDQCEVFERAFAGGRVKYPVAVEGPDGLAWKEKAQGGPLAGRDQPPLDGAGRVVGGATDPLDRTGISAVAAQRGGGAGLPQTGIPVYAVFGARNAPTDAQLTNVDLLVFDLQDVGVRFYTFVWTMTYCMEAAARNGKPFYVIDRPNPTSGMRVEGAPNPVDYGLIGRLGPGAAFGVATRHGLTAGEIAWMWNGEWMSPKVELHVIAVPNWSRAQWWTDTRRVFVPPSPNMRTPAAATVYPGTCIFEGSNLSVGRGTERPFEQMGAPFISGANWAACLNTNGLAGVRFDAVTFMPTNYPGAPWVNQTCGGVQVVVTNRDTFDPIRTGLFMLQTVYKLYPSQVSITPYAASLMGVPGLDSSIKTADINTIIAGWESNLAQFRALRRLYLLYPETTPCFSSIRVPAPARTQVNLSWTGLNGRCYRLSRRDSLSAPWNTTSDYRGAGNELTVTDAIGPGLGFYRLELLP